MVCVLPPPLSVAATFPPKLPADDELKLTVIVQDFPGATLVQLFVSEKGGFGLALMLLMVRIAVPVLVNVIVCDGAEQLVFRKGI